MSKIEKETTPLEKMFEPRKYTDAELQDFHNKIQKFYDPLTQVNLNGVMVDAQKFRHEDLHVAFGAARRVPYGKNAKGEPHFQYLYNNERYEVFNNLWKQYEDFMRKKDWFEKKQIENLEQTAEQIPF